MCGRFQLEYGIEQLMFRFDAQNRYIGYGTKHEIFPTDMIAIIKKEGKQNYIEAAKWGLDNHIDKRPLINARGETVGEKRTFKCLFSNSRCIIPATAFYEWKKNIDSSKTKMQISVKDMPVFGMAGLYRKEVTAEGDTVLKCTIITTAASNFMSEIHERMPVIIPPDKEKIWMDNTIVDVYMLQEFIRPYTGELCFTE